MERRPWRKAVRWGPVGPARLVALLAASLVACGGGDGAGTSAPPPQPPTGLQLSWVEFDRLAIRWTRSTSRVDRYVVEGRIESDPWQVLSDQVPADAVGAYLTVAASTPELVTIALRMRAVAGTASSDYTPEASVLRGLRAPSGLSAHAVFEDVDIAWTQGSTAAASVSVERALWNDIDGVPGPYHVVATLPAASTSWRDGTTDAPGYLYQYRVTNVGAYRGAEVRSDHPIQLADDRTWLAPPASFQATLVGTDVQMSWTPRTRIAVVQRVERSPATAERFEYLAELGAGATSFVDRTTPAGPYRYRVTASLPTTLFGTVASAEVPISVPPAPGSWGLEQSVLHVPQADGTALGADGAWWFSRHWGVQWVAPAKDTGVLVPSAGGWSAHRFPGSLGTEYLVEPGLLLDPTGQPHAFWLLDIDPRPTTAKVLQLRHAWRDGAGWHDEPVADREVLNSNESYYAQFALDGAGAAHVIWRAMDRSGTTAVTLNEYATNAGGGWSITSLPATLLEPFLVSSFRLAAAPDGTAHVAVVGTVPGTNDIGIVLLRRTPGGSWSEEVVPTGPLAYYDSMWMVAHDASTVDLLYTQKPSNLDPTTYWFTQRTGAGWATAESLGEVYALSGYLLPNLATSPDGTRRAALLELLDGLHLATWEAGSGWSTERMGPTVPFDFPWLGFDAGGAVHVLLPGGIPGADGFTDRVHIRSTR